MKLFSGNLKRICLASIALQILFSLIMLITAPSRIVAHYDASGEATRYGSKYEILIVLVTTIVIVILAGILFEKALKHPEHMHGFSKDYPASRAVQVSYVFLSSIFTTIALAAAYYMSTLTEGNPFTLWPIFIFLLSTWTILGSLENVRACLWQSIIPLASILLVSIHYRIGLSQAILGALLILLIFHSIYILVIRKRGIAR
ncbi:MAG: DUF1648 domain-containing protein [Eubacteriales bacterium]|nr:DUF1648 domain-containing protein [Eubacteriales bacterium]